MPDVIKRTVHQSITITVWRDFTWFKESQFQLQQSDSSVSFWHKLKLKKSNSESETPTNVPNIGLYVKCYPIVAKIGMNSF